MLYLKRKSTLFLSEWKANPDKKPLIVSCRGRSARLNPFSALLQRTTRALSRSTSWRSQSTNDHRGFGCKTADIIKNISRIDPSKRFY